MKRLLMMAAFAVAALVAKAHNFHNDSPCEVQFRVVCIDVTGAPTGCTVTGAATGWITVGPHSVVPIPPGCTPPDEIGYEVQYGPSTGCAGPTVTVKPPPGLYSTAVCNAYPHDDFLPPCPCNPSGNGLHVHANPDNVHIIPQ